MLKKAINKNDILLILSLIYATVSVCMNVWSVKPLSFGLNMIIMDAGLIISWIPYLISSIITECYGENVAKKITIATTITVFLLSIIAWALTYVPTLPGYIEQDKHFKYVFNSGPRIIIASALAFVVGSFINIDLTSDKKNKKYVSIFAKILFAGLISQFIDNIIFETIAFAPIGISLFELKWIDVMTATIWSTIIEVVFEGMFILPVAKPLIKYIKNFKK